MKTFLRFTLRLLLLGGLLAVLRRAFEFRRSAADHGGEGPSRATLTLVGGEPSPFIAVRQPPAVRVPVAAGVAGGTDPLDGSCPPGFPIKGKRTSGIFHVPGGLSYDRTVPDRCYATPADAEADGLRAARR